ncbi:hypothetical protein U1Q18_001111 [Sarracenia purpurea var. burkii]
MCALSSCWFASVLGGCRQISFVQAYFGSPTAAFVLLLGFQYLHVLSLLFLAADVYRWRFAFATVLWEVQRVLLELVALVPCLQVVLVCFFHSGDNLLLAIYCCCSLPLLGSLAAIFGGCRPFAAIMVFNL